MPRAAMTASSAPAVVLTRRALNRALLERQLLLRRQQRPAVDVIEHLVGLQGQAPKAPYLALWTRLENFQPAELAELMAHRGVVRAQLLRATIHTVTARDCLALRPILQPVLERCFHSQSPFGRRLAGMDFPELLAVGRELLTEQPRTRAELSPLLGERWPDRDAEAMAQAVTFMEPVVQVTPRGIWGQSGKAAWAPVETWLGRPLESEPSLDELVRRYLAAFGPATAGDVRTWSGLTGMRDVLERLRPQLRTFRDEQGRELFDLPGAPLPDPETPAPVRFLPEYDNIALSHADRGRIMGSDGFPILFAGKNGLVGSVLVDGFVEAAWTMARERDAARLRVHPLRPLTKDERAAVADEGEKLLAFAAADASDRDIQFVPAERRA